MTQEKLKQAKLIQEHISNYEVHKSIFIDKFYDSSKPTMRFPKTTINKTQ